ncbi:MAG TPA: hypothetical protein VHY09_12625 [Candidatus Methylacidiphilales bacterium]|jgi:hypothetical protein|nr:hypothetical protein [Candidatus Methylacidiphilales bacterium]
MNFRDVPNLQKFEQHARVNSENEVVMDCYKRVRELIAPVPKPPDPLQFNSAVVADLKASCEAVEKSTRLIWACAAATGEITPPLWDIPPDYESSLGYFLGLKDLELMDVTQRHRITWEATADVKK